MPDGGAVCYLLDVLLEDAQLQPLVEPHLAVLPDVLQLPLVVQHLMDDVQDVVHGLRVVGRGRERVGAAGRQGPLELVEQGLPVLAHLPGDTRAIISQQLLQNCSSAQAMPRSLPSRARQACTDTRSPIHTQPKCKSEFHSKAHFIKTKIKFRTNPSVIQ